MPYKVQGAPGTAKRKKAMKALGAKGGAGGKGVKKPRRKGLSKFLAK